MTEDEKREILILVHGFIVALENARADFWSAKFGAEMQKDIAGSLENALPHIPEWIKVLRGE